MINLTADYNWISINQSTTVDTYGNPVIDVTLTPGPWKVDTDARLLRLEQRLEEIDQRELEEKRLRSEHPGLEEAHKQYQTVLGLVRDKDRDDKCDPV